jgi:hypothetical protein
MLLIADKDVAGARAALDTAVVLNPKSAAAFTYRALVSALAGESQSAIHDANHALRLSPLDPLSYLPHMAILIASLWLREYDEAIASGHKAIELAPRYPMGYAWVIVAECERGNLAEAERQARRLAEILPGFTPAMLAKLFEIFPDPRDGEVPLHAQGDWRDPGGHGVMCHRGRVTMVVAQTISAHARHDAVRRLALHAPMCSASTTDERAAGPLRLAGASTVDAGDGVVRRKLSAVRGGPPSVRPTPNGIARGAIAMCFGSGLGGALNSIRSLRALMRTRIASPAVASPAASVRRAAGISTVTSRRRSRRIADARTVRIRQFREFGLESARDAAAQVAQQVSVRLGDALSRTGRRIA